MLLNLIAYASAFECARNENHCVTSLYIRYAHTMYHEDYDTLHTKGRRLFYTDANTGESIPLPSNEHVNTADGVPRPQRITVANGTMPGPQIVLHEKQTISIIVHNELYNEAVTIHWHGVDQQHTPFMDGVAFVTQCPIAPGQSFNYTFRPRFGGTFWYHSHIGYQRTQGLYGAFIVLRRHENLTNVGHVLMVSDYNHENDFIPGYYTSIPQSVLINGKGDYGNNEAPLEVLPAKSGNRIRFRLIHVGYRMRHMLGIDGHKLNVIATDGFPVERTTVDRILTFPGERFDFTIDVGSPGIYNINAGMYMGTRLIYRGAGKAFLNVTHDKAASSTSDTTSKLKVLNCPSLVLPSISNAECILLSELRDLNDSRHPSKVKANNAMSTDPLSHQTLFLTLIGTIRRPAINNFRFKLPSVSAISQPNGFTHCPTIPDGKPCTYSLNIDKDANITMVLINIGTGAHQNLPIHVHGHTFEVIKMGLPTVHEDGTSVHNNDIKCETGASNENSNCSNPSWRDETWNERIPGLSPKPVRKDTVVVPYGGYTIIRFKASNPGIWLLHGHDDFHSIQGMALVLNESFNDFGVQPFYTIPSGFPVCHDYSGIPTTG